VWYVFAPQCLSTLAVVRRETNSWRYPLFMAGYLFALAYIGSFITYRIALASGGG
jgi:ferrous iron transport protein B